VSTSYGTNELTAPVFGVNTPSANFWDIAPTYNGDWGNWKVSAAYAFTWQETAMGPVLAGTGAFGVPILTEGHLHQAGATIMHVPSGLGLYGLYQKELAGPVPDTDVWYLKPFIKRTWMPLGATVLYGEWGRYEDQFASLWNVGQCGNLTPVGGGGNLAAFCGAAIGNQAFVTGSEVDRFGLGVVQEIDSAAMHLFARWQHQEIDVNLIGLNGAGLAVQRVGQGFKSWNGAQIGGVLFF
jgi:hypothetical protein